MSPARRLAPHALPLLVVLALVACAGRTKLLAPTLAVERLKLEKLQITGASVLVGFKLRNTNPDPIRIERLVYDLVLNGRKLGTGYVTDAVDMEGFGQAQVESRFDLSTLKLPSVVKAVLDQDRVDAEVEGTFFATAAGRQHKLAFATAGNVALDR